MAMAIIFALEQIANKKNVTFKQKNITHNPLAPSRFIGWV